MKNYNKLFISIASNPGIFGSTIYNKFFSDYKLAYFYKALKVEKSTLKKIIKNLNTFNISGCSVSMPFKSDVITFLDVVDKNAKEIGSVNTILNISGKLIGYNTDFFGIQKCIRKIKLNKKDKVLIIGAGGIAKTICHCLCKIKFNNVFITSRTLDKSVILSKKYKFNYINWDERNGLNCNILINASPIGMNPYQNEIPISFSSIKNMRVVFDVVNKPLHTKLINYCNKNHIKNIPGFELSINQLIKQIYIYTGEKTTYNYIRKILKV